MHACVHGVQGLLAAASSDTERRVAAAAAQAARAGEVEAAATAAAKESERKRQAQERKLVRGRQACCVRSGLPSAQGCVAPGTYGMIMGAAGMQAWLHLLGSALESLSAGFAYLPSSLGLVAGFLPGRRQQQQVFVLLNLYRLTPAPLWPRRARSGTSSRRSTTRCWPTKRTSR